MDDIARDFADKSIPLIKEKMPLTAVFGFGSRFDGNSKPDSDLDLIVVSPSFKEIPVPNRAFMLWDLLRPSTHLDALCYTDDEFERMKQKSLFIQHILGIGQRIC